MIIDQIVHRIRAKNLRKGFSIQQLITHALWPKIKHFSPRLLRLKVAGGLFSSTDFSLVSVTQI